MRYGIRQVLDQEYQKNLVVLANASRQARYQNGNPEAASTAELLQNKENPLGNLDEKITEIKKDFFGRVIKESKPLQEIDGNANSVESTENAKNANKTKAKEDLKIWVTFHEGFSNAVRKPITVQELLKGL